MQVVVLKPFPYGADGIHVRELAAGAIEEIRDDLVAGLKAERYVREAGAGETPAPAPVAVPAAEEAPSAAVPDEVLAMPPAAAEPRPRRARKA